jgi:bifunctional non-homologous end joining protein LigD
VLLDGEVVALDAGGRPSFQLLQNRRARSGALHYYAYDLLWLDGRDMRDRPLAERKERLAEVVAGTAVRFSKALPGGVAKVVAAVKSLGLEGVVAKRAGSKYESGGRSGSWLKLKLSPEQEFVIGGYKPGAPLESLVVGVYEGRKLLCAGKVRQGLNPQNRRSLAALLDPHRAAKCPFSNLPNSRKGHWGEGITSEDMQTIVWVKPRFVAHISFTEWTEGGNLRHATYLGLRTDKLPKEVVRET